MLKKKFENYIYKVLFFKLDIWLQKQKTYKISLYNNVYVGTYYYNVVKY